MPAGLVDSKPATMSVATDGHIQQRYRHTALIFVHMYSLTRINIVNTTPVACFPQLRPSAAFGLGLAAENKRSKQEARSRSAKPVYNDQWQ